MSFENIEFVCKFTSELTNDEWFDFMSTHHEVKKPSEEIINRFENLYKNNIYGDSVHVIVYADGVPLATNAHLRNDLCQGVPSYQSMHTYVSPKLRRMGVFGKMSKMCVEKSSPGYIYGFPNSNSYPGFMKLGWTVVRSGVSSLFVGLAGSVAKLYKKQVMIPDDYFFWRYGGDQENYRVCHRKNVTLLLKVKHSRIGRQYIVVGRVSDVAAQALLVVSPILVFAYMNGNYLYLIRKFDSTLIENTTHRNLDVDIPMWRCDSL